MAKLRFRDENGQMVEVDLSKLGDENEDPEERTRYNQYLELTVRRERGKVEQRFAPPDDGTKILVNEIQRFWDERERLITEGGNGSDKEIDVCDNVIHSHCFNHPPAFRAWLKDMLEKGRGGRVYRYAVHLTETLRIGRWANPREGAVLDEIFKSKRLPPGFRAQRYAVGKREAKDGGTETIFAWLVPLGTGLVHGSLMKTQNQFEEDVFEILELLRRARQEDRRRPEENNEEEE